jgi:phage terminase small subunit
MTATPRRKPKSKAMPKTKRERQIEETNRLATLITSAPNKSGEMAAPGLIRDPRSAPALSMWREIVPLLQARRVLDDADRFQLALLCYWGRSLSLRPTT